MTGLFGFHGSGFKCEVQILLRFCLQMLNHKTLKPNDEIYLKYKYQLKQKPISREKML